MSEEDPHDVAEPEDCLSDTPTTDDTEEEWSLDHGDEFEPGPIPKVIGRDGLPTQAVPVQRSDVPELSLETLICMADTSKFVVRDSFGDILCEFQPTEVERAPEGLWRVRWELFQERMKLRTKEFRQMAADTGYGNAVAALDDYEFLREIFSTVVRSIVMSRKWVQVEPIRKACSHYRRKHIQYDMSPEHRKIVRLCTARRDTSGAFMSVSDRAVWACELRDPPVLSALDELDEFDNRKIAQGSDREYLSILDPGHGQAGGIFGSNPRGECK